MTTPIPGACRRINWTDAAKAELKRRFDLGETDATIAGALGTTRPAVQVQRSKMGLVREAKSAVAATRRRHLDATREARKIAAEGFPVQGDAADIDDEDLMAMRLKAANVEYARRLDACGRRFEDVRLRRVA